MKTIQMELLKEIIDTQKINLYSKSIIGKEPDLQSFFMTLDDILFLAERKSKPQDLNITLHYGINCQSKGEKRIANVLTELGYTPYHNVIKRDCCGEFRALPFDFGMLVNGRELLIEYDGEQHETPIDFFGGTGKLEEIRKYDEIKTKYCKENNIPLLRIKPGTNIKLAIVKFIEKHGNT